MARCWELGTSMGWSRGCIAHVNVIILYVVAEKAGNQMSFRLLEDGLLEDPLTECLETSLEILTHCHFHLLSSLQTFSRSFP